MMQNLFWEWDGGDQYLSFVHGVGVISLVDSTVEETS